MNQIPNIEETNTREIEDKLEKLESIILLRVDRLFIEGTVILLKDYKETLAQQIRAELHHQLQKVRESCICKDKGVIELLEEQNKEAKSKIASLYLPAHEVSHGKDCIECKEIAAYNAAIQDAIKVITVIYHSELDQPISPTDT